MSSVARVRDCRTGTIRSRLMDGLAKLLEVILVGVGSIGGVMPWWRRQLARAEAEKVKLLGAAQIEVDVARERALAEFRQEQVGPTVLLTAPVDLDLLVERAHSRVQEQERRRQCNLEAIGFGAALLLPPGSVSDEPVDADWIARFFGSAQDVSAPELQRLWSGLLAGEVARPGAFSLRCVEVLRNLSLVEARMFEGLRESCRLPWNDSSSNVLPDDEYGTWLSDTARRSWPSYSSNGRENVRIEHGQAVRPVGSWRHPDPVPREAPGALLALGKACCLLLHDLGRREHHELCLRCHRLRDRRQPAWKSLKPTRRTSTSV